MSNKRTVSIGYIDEISISTAICYTDGINIKIEKIYHLPNGITQTDRLDTSELTNRTEVVGVIVGDYCSPGAVIQNYTPAMLQIERRKRGVEDDTHHAEIIEVNGTGLYAALDRQQSHKLIKNLRALCPKVERRSINSWLFAMYYAYIRCYLDLQTTVVMVNVTKSSVTMLALNSEFPVWAGARAFENHDSLFTHISEMVDIAKVLIGSQPSVMLISGMATPPDLISLKSLQITERVEFFDLFRNGAFEIGDCDRFTREELMRNRHLYVLTIAAAGMLIEEVGVNLSDTDLPLSHSIPIEQSIYVQRSLSTVVTQSVSELSQKALPILYQRKWFLVAVLIISLLIPVYRIVDRQKQISEIDRQTNAEKERAKTLEAVKQRYDAFKEKKSLIEQRIEYIQQVRAKQLTVRTVLYQVDQRVPAGLVFSDYEVNGTNVTIKGTAPDRTAVTAFANTLGQSVGQFVDVTVFYDDKSNTGSFVIGCNYIGKVQPNTIKVTNTDISNFLGR